MLYAAVFQVCDAIAMVHICALRGAGDTTYTMWVTSLCAWVFTVPCAWFFRHACRMGRAGGLLGIDARNHRLVLRHLLARSSNRTGNAREARFASR